MGARGTVLGISALLAVASFGLQEPALASDEIAAAEEVACTVCHDPPGSKLLTDKGKYYELMRSFDGYDEVKAEFGRCTHCHVEEPGSTELTEDGRRFAWVVQDMEGLRAWVKSSHPGEPFDGSEAEDDAAQP